MLCDQICGPQALVNAALIKVRKMVIFLFTAILYIVLSVGILVMASAKPKESMGKMMWNAWKEVMKNPLIIASLASIFTALFYIKLPPFVNGTIKNFAFLTTWRKDE